MQNIKKYYPVFMSILSSVVKHLCVTATFLIVKYLFFFFAPRFTPDEKMLWQTLVMVAVYLSTSFAFSLYDKIQFAVFAKKEKQKALPELLSFNFIFDLCVTVVFFVFIVSDFVHPITVIFAVFSNIGTYIFARTHWLSLIERKKNSWLFTAKFLLHILLAIPGLFVFFFLVSYIIPTVSTIVMVLKLISYTLIIPLVIAVILYIRALKKMSSFLKRLNKYCSEKKVKAPKIKSPYLSVFKNRPKNTFEIEINGKIYTCNLISFTNIFKPVIFKSDGFFYRISARALKRNDRPSMLFESSFEFESSHPRIVIMPSSPYVVMLQEGSMTKTFDTGDICGNYKLFTPDGFFGAAERNTLSRKSYE
ncbi:MAG: hypothetical protein IJN17_04690 [Clostridia bacterium]|nr:hypothetical protein [Clostridia bacterium]